jgi:ABC-2 type transport system ATP-binding protein
MGDSRVEASVQCRETVKAWPRGFTLGPVNFQASPGETIAVFGKNGAGKSTFFELLTGSIDRTGGDITVLGHIMSPDAVEVRSRIGYLPQESRLPDWTTADEILSYAARVRGIRDIADTVDQHLKKWDAFSWRHRPLIKTSHGMQRRVGLAVAMIHNPDLLILDEPFNALDIVNARVLESEIKRRGEAGQTTLLSIHSPLLAAHLCARAVLIQNGSLMKIPGWSERDLRGRADLVERYFFGEQA